MRKLFQKMYEQIVAGQSVVLASVIASSGSTPRGAGARMLVCADGESFGTIGGGAIEYKSQQLAREVIKSKQSYVKGFILSHNDVADLGMICGGDVIVYFQYFAGGDEKNIELLEKIKLLFERNVNSWLITDISDEIAWGLGVYVEGEGIIGNMEINAGDILPLLDTKSVWHEEKGKRYYIEPLVRAGRVYVFGGGHVAQELIPVLSHIGFRCVVMDDRPEFTGEEVFPEAETTYLGDFNDIGASLQIDGSDYIVIMTRGHKNDYSVLVHALRTEAYYIGMIGSRTKVAATFEKLQKEEGFTRDELSRIYTPIGLKIKAETPAEIAISIAAQLIEVRAGNK